MVRWAAKYGFPREWERGNVALSVFGHKVCRNPSSGLKAGGVFGAGFSCSVSRCASLILKQQSHAWKYIWNNHRLLTSTIRKKINPDVTFFQKLWMGIIIDVFRDTQHYLSIKTLSWKTLNFQISFYFFFFPYCLQLVVKKRLCQIWTLLTKTPSSRKAI